MRFVRPVSGFRSAVIAVALLALAGSPRFVPSLRQTLLKFSPPSLSQSAPRKIYPYSVIVGGAYSDRELSLARRVDRIVAIHYADFKPSATLRSIPNDMLMYVSYRKADKVYWTKAKHRIPKGESVLCDGDNYARARCGNRLSFKPLAPTFPGNEPEEEALNIPEAPNVPLLLSSLPPNALPQLDFYIPASFNPTGPLDESPGGGTYGLQTPRLASPGGGASEAPYSFGPFRGGGGPFLGNSIFYPPVTTSSLGTPAGASPIGGGPGEIAIIGAEAPEPGTIRLLLLAALIAPALFFRKKANPTVLS
jgi:hypothetical protein